MKAISLTLVMLLFAGSLAGCVSSSQHDGVVAERDELNDEIILLEEDKTILENDKAELEGVVSDLENDKAELEGVVSDLESSISVLEGSVQSKNSQIESLNSIIDQKNLQISALEQMLNLSEANFSQISSELANLTSELEDLMEIHHNLTLELQQANSDLEALGASYAQALALLDVWNSYGDVIINSSPEVEGCPMVAPGATIISGFDNDSDGVLTGDEVQSTETHCPAAYGPVAWLNDSGFFNGFNEHTILDDYLYFPYEGGIWRTDGTLGGTEGYILANEFNPYGLVSAEAECLFTWNGRLYFHLYNSSGFDVQVTRHGIFYTDGIPDAGEDASMAIGRLPLPVGQARSWLGVKCAHYDAGDTMFFSYNTTAHGDEIWKTDGVNASIVSDINAGSEGSFAMFAGMWKVGDWYLFTADDGSHGYEWWRTDGTPQNTSLVKDIHNFGDGVAHNRLHYSKMTFATMAMDENGAMGVYFTGYTPATGHELWVTDGTPSGTSMVHEVNPGPDDGLPVSFWSGSPRELESGLNEGQSGLFFTGKNSLGENPWYTRGSSTTTYMLADLDTDGSESGAVYNFKMASGNGVFFQKNDFSVSPNSYFIYYSDGTPSGTRIVADWTHDGSSGDIGEGGGVIDCRPLGLASYEPHNRNGETQSYNGWISYEANLESGENHPVLFFELWCGASKETLVYLGVSGSNDYHVELVGVNNPVEMMIMNGNLYVAANMSHGLREEWTINTITLCYHTDSNCQDSLYTWDL